MSGKRCSQHVWQPLFHEPPITSPRLVADYYFLRDRDLVVCSACDALGRISRGYRKGGGHKIYRLAEHPHDTYRPQAARWNREVEAARCGGTTLASEVAS